MRDSDANTAATASRVRAVALSRPIETSVTPATSGTSRRNSPICPRAARSLSQRQPGTRSAPSRRSTPPPSGSRSTRAVAPSAVPEHARPTAKVEAPTPPEPPSTAIRDVRRDDPVRPASTSASHAPPSGSTIVAAPSGTEADNAAGDAEASASTYTPRLDGKPHRAASTARSAPTSTTRASRQRPINASASLTRTTGLCTAAPAADTAAAIASSAVHSSVSILTDCSTPRPCAHIGDFVTRFERCGKPLSHSCPQLPPRRSLRTGHRVVSIRSWPDPFFPSPR